MNKIEKIELEKSIRDLTARNNEIKGLILAENSLGNAEKLDAEYQANEIKIIDAQNKLNENTDMKSLLCQKLTHRTGDLENQYSLKPQKIYLTHRTGDLEIWP